MPIAPLSLHHAARITLVQRLAARTISARRTAAQTGHPLQVTQPPGRAPHSTPEPGQPSHCVLPLWQSPHRPHRPVNLGTAIPILFLISSELLLLFCSTFICFPVPATTGRYSLTKLTEAQTMRCAMHIAKRQPTSYVKAT